MDFTVRIYKRLLEQLVRSNYAFQTYAEFIRSPLEKSIVLRHDVDLLPANSLAFAKIQQEAGVKGVYYFRAVPESWDERIIREIAAMGHEIGYHYECLTTCRGNMHLAIADFEKNLAALRQLATVSTICMHGSPMSRYDSKDLWKSYSYRDFGIIAEPYFDTDFNRVFYLTDTGRKWDGEKVSVRDKVNSGPFNLVFKNTEQIIACARDQGLPSKIMFTFHPQRWSDDMLLWYKELILQNLKNQVKRILVK